jgi:N-methylhydantoinase A
MDGKKVSATVYQRSKLAAGNILNGPAIVIEMDSTTVVLPGHQGLVDDFGNILIYPEGHKLLRH